VDISFTVCFFACIFVILCVCTVSDFSGEDNANGVKFCTVVQGCPGQGISHFGELLPQKPKIGRSGADVGSACVGNRQSSSLAVLVFKKSLHPITKCGGIQPPHFVMLGPNPLPIERPDHWYNMIRDKTI